MDTNYPTTGSLVWHLALQWRTQVDRAIAGFGLTHAQYSVLASLHALTGQGGAPTQRELADYTGLQPIFVSKLLKALDTDGMIVRQPDKADSRANRLSLTNKGQRVIVEAMVVVRDLDRRLTEPLGGPDSERTREFASTLQFLLNR